MKACVLEDIGRLVYQTVEQPHIKENQVLLKIKACGICSSDINRIFKTGTYHFPTIPGHEFAGQIVEIGSQVPTAYLNKRAVVFPLLPCMKCASCQSQQYARCENYNYFGSRCDGGFAEYLAVPLWNIVTFSDSLDYKTAALCEPAAVALHSLHAAEPLTGKTIAIIGTGTIAFLTALWAQEAGAKTIIMAGRSDSKRTFAQEFGISNLIYVSQNPLNQIQEQTNGAGADTVFECVGSAEAVTLAIAAAKKGGTVILTGNPASDISLPQQIYWKILRNELTIHGTWNSSYSDQNNDWKKTLIYMEKHKLTLQKLITHTFDLSCHHDAFKRLLDPEEFSMKVMFVM